MSALLDQFLSETRDFLQSIGVKLMELETAPDSAETMVELFRLVHTLKGNSGLFDFPEMTRVLHAAEDVMDVVRDGDLSYSQDLADNLLDAMDFVGRLCDEIEENGAFAPSTGPLSVDLAKSLRALLAEAQQGDGPLVDGQSATEPASEPAATVDLSSLPEAALITAYVEALRGKPIHHLTFTPDEQCFFQGDDPLFTVRQLPGAVWVWMSSREEWPDLVELDAYRCVLKFDVLVAASADEISEHFRYVPDQIVLAELNPKHLLRVTGRVVDANAVRNCVATGRALAEAGDTAALSAYATDWLAQTEDELFTASVLRWLVVMLEQDCASPEIIERYLSAIETQSFDAAPIGAASQSAAFPAEFIAALSGIIAAQRTILSKADTANFQAGRVKVVGTVLRNCALSLANRLVAARIEAALEQALTLQSAQPLLDSLTAFNIAEDTGPPSTEPKGAATPEPEPNETAKAVRRSDDAPAGAKSLKVDQAKIDLLMNLIGEMVVAKNAMPYLATRAEEEFGMRELAREIKAQFAVINRIAEEMQGAIMQVRMMPVSFVFQRFPRLVRDLSRKLGKEVHLELEGEETEADKNIIEALADPLIHIVRNSLDHGIEMPDVRLAAGKPAQGSLTIRASQEGDLAIIEIVDDGKGIDPAVIRRKAYEKGIIDETALERLSDKEAINLIFAAGFSTADVVSDLSGRGVGMDVVRTAVEKVNGTIGLDSEAGRGTRIRIALPLSMAVTKVMIIESDDQRFGIPMEHVLETVRVPQAAVRSIKDKQVITLRGSVTPLVTLNDRLQISRAPKRNDDDELAVLVVRYGAEAVGLLVDDFHETIDVIQKPLEGVLGALNIYSGSALMGNGSVLMVLNLKELV